MSLRSTYFQLLYDREAQGIDNELLEDALFHYLSNMSTNELKKILLEGY